MWQAPLSSIHSLPSSRDVSVEDHPRAVYCQGLYFVGLARTLPPLPIHHPLVFSKKLSRIPIEDPPEEGRMEGLHVSVRLALEDRHAQGPQSVSARVMGLFGRLVESETI